MSSAKRQGDKEKEVKVVRSHFSTEDTLYELSTGKVLRGAGQKHQDTVLSYFFAELQKNCPEKDSDTKYRLGQQ